MNLGAPRRRRSCEGGYGDAKSKATRDDRVARAMTSKKTDL